MKNTVEKLFRTLSFFIFTLLITGCAATNIVDNMTAQAYDNNKGTVVGVVFERSVFVPYGAYFTIKNEKGDRFILSSGGNNKTFSIVNEPPIIPKGIGKPFVLQLPPGKYFIDRWALDYGGRDKISTAFANPLQFEVLQGKISYLGRFDANRFLELASIENKFDSDVIHIRKNQLIGDKLIDNKSLNAKGWWLPNASGKEMVEKRGGICDQC